MDFSTKLALKVTDVKRKVIAGQTRGEQLAFTGTLVRAETNKNRDHFDSEGMQQIADTLPGMPVTDEHSDTDIVGFFHAARVLDDAVEAEAVIWPRRFPEITARLLDGNLAFSIEAFAEKVVCSICQQEFFAKDEECACVANRQKTGAARLMRNVRAFGGGLVRFPAGTNTSIRPESFRLVASELAAEGIDLPAITDIPTNTTEPIASFTVGPHLYSLVGVSSLNLGPLVTTTNTTGMTYRFAHEDGGLKIYPIDNANQGEEVIAMKTAAAETPVVETEVIAEEVPVIQAEETPVAATEETPVTPTPEDEFKASIAVLTARIAELEPQVSEIAALRTQLTAVSADRDLMKGERDTASATASVVKLGAERALQAAAIVGAEEAAKHYATFASMTDDAFALYLDTADRSKATGLNLPRLNALGGQKIDLQVNTEPNPEKVGWDSIFAK